MHKKKLTVIKVVMRNAETLIWQGRLARLCSQACSFRCVGRLVASSTSSHGVRQG